MLGVFSPREPISPEFSKEVRAALWRSMTGNLTDKERETRRRCRAAARRWKIVKEWAGSPNLDSHYEGTFYAKPRYPALDIAYLAVQEKYRGRGIGTAIIEQIAEDARSQSFAGCQFLTVEALVTKEYSAVGFYDRCGFSANELRKPYKDTIRMFRTLYEKEI